MLTFTIELWIHSSHTKCTFVTVVFYPFYYSSCYTKMNVIIFIKRERLLQVAFLTPMLELSRTFLSMRRTCPGSRFSDKNGHDQMLMYPAMYPRFVSLIVVIYLVCSVDNK